jgi:hypothetical protein
MYLKPAKVRSVCWAPGTVGESAKGPVFLSTVSGPARSLQCPLQFEPGLNRSTQHLEQVVSFQKLHQEQGQCFCSWVEVRGMVSPAGPVLGLHTTGLPLGDMQVVLRTPQPVGSTWPPHKWGWQPLSGSYNKRKVGHRARTKTYHMPGRW